MTSTESKVYSKMTDEFIYSIRNIFCESQESLFYYTKTNAVYIGPYQRGYKWMSEKQCDQVPQLLNDIQNASETSGHEYYLQYITESVYKKKGTD